MTDAFSIIGLGKLGASMAAAIAKRGFRVIGVDVNQDSVDAVNAGHAPVQETDLEETIAAYKGSIRATTSHEEAIAASSLSFVIVPTPSDVSGAFSLQYAKWAFKEIGRALRRKGSYHTVVLTSTVLPGSTRCALLPILESESGLKAGEGFGLCYSPEFIALGSVIENFLNPDFTLVGEFDRKSGDLLEEAYARILPAKPPCRRMSLENAELAKISINAFVTAKISFANMLSEICERIPGGDIDAVTAALGSDSRIGRKYLKGGLGFGGPCFPRDNVAISFVGSQLGVSCAIPKATDAFNRDLPSRVAQRIADIVPLGRTVAVLGLAYKPSSHVIEESQALAIALRLSDQGYRVLAYDPLASSQVRASFPQRVVTLSSAKACLAEADAVVIATPEPEFAALRPSDFSLRPVDVFDLWRLLDGDFAAEPGIRLRQGGRCSDCASAERKLLSIWEGR